MDSLRAQLFDEVATLAVELSAGQADALALDLEAHDAPVRLRRLGRSVSRSVVNRLCDLWQRTDNVTGQHLADALRSAASAVRASDAYERIELLYTGPSADRIRRTKRGLLEVVREARTSLWVVSYVVSGGSEDVLDAVHERTEAGVMARFLVDHRTDGSAVALRRIRSRVPDATIYEWPDDARVIGDKQYANLHAKCAISDYRKAFVSSANLTGWAMDHNLEVGYLVTGGTSPRTLQEYFEELVDAEILQALTS